jgi:hypothetical protein
VSLAANLSPVINNGTVSSVLVLSGGAYGGSAAPTVSVVDVGAVATATATLMPLGIQGTSVETYQGYVWIVQGPVLYNSAPGTVSNFSTSSGGGNKTSNSSNLRIGYTRLLAVNGFLYTIADSSLDYVSNVQTQGSPIATTYSWQNADTEAGCPYPEGAMTWGRGLFFVNPFGIQVLYGSEVKKASNALDGVFNSAPSFSGAQISVAQHEVFGRKIAMALVPIIDPVTGLLTNKLLCFDGQKWFASQQDKNLLYVKHQEINSLITAYGTDGSSIFPLFSSPSSGFTKTLQTRLWDIPGGYQFLKGNSRFWSIAQIYDPSALFINLSVDNESSSFTYAQNPIQWYDSSGALASWSSSTGAAVFWYVSTPSLTGSYNVQLMYGAAVIWLNAANNVATWVNALNNSVQWAGDYEVYPSFVISQPQMIGQWGVLTGFTLSTTHPNMALVAAMMQPEMAGYRG